MHQLENEELINVNLVLNNLADDISRAHHLQFLAWHYLRKDYIFTRAPIETENRYVIPQVLPLLSQNDIYLDVGAHVGEVIIKFKQLIGNKFRKTYAIEADSKSYEKLTENLRLEGFNAGSVITINEVAGATNESCRYFEGIGYASQKSSFGSIIKASMRIDELNFERVTLVKIHLEGWELDALKGLISTIMRCRPIIMVTIYHNHQGLWEIPAWLMKNLDKYTYYERMHSWCGTGLVIYCIPE
jgi:FkbM family methyltransferase